MTLTPRPYQLQAKRAAYKAFRGGARSALIVMPTGTGKGACIGMVARDAVEQGKRVLAFVHRKEIVDQLADHVRKWANVDVAIEQAERAEATEESPVVVGSVASLIRRLDRLHPDRFDLVIADEFHHGLAASWRTLLDHFASARVLGFTATPNRGDERALAQVVDELAFDMSLPDAIQGGWLVPFRTVTVPLKSLDLSAVRRRHGELVAGDLGAVMSTVAVMREAIGPALELAADKQAIVFTCTRSHMHATAECIRQMAEERRIRLPVATVDGTTPPAERDRIMDEFRARRIRWLVNVDVATEGFDVPGIEAVIRLRPTLVRARYIQELGRGGRPLAGLVDGLTAEDMMVRLDGLMASGEMTDPEGWVARAVVGVHLGDVAAARRLAIALSEKPECLVVDCTDDSGKYSLADEMDLLGGDYSEPEQREAREILARGDASHLLDALERARAARQARLRVAQARAGDPFALFDLPCRRDRYEREPTKKHRRVLGPLRLPLGELDWRMANNLCDEIARREREDLCLYEQARILARLGCPVDWLPTLTRAEASRLIEALAGDYWQRPKDWPGMRRAVTRS